MKTIIKIIREKRGFTQVQVADKAQLSERSYQRYETGERLPNVQVAQMIAKALNTTVEELFPLSNAKQINQLNNNTRKEK